MMENQLKDEVLEGASGGRFAQQHTNFCPRCRSASYTVLQVEKGIEHRECKTCHLKYDYRKW